MKTHSIELLLNELKTLQRCRYKSIESFSKGNLDIEKHKIHLNSLKPKIENLELSIKILNEDILKRNASEADEV